MTAHRHKLVLAALAAAVWAGALIGMASAHAQAANYPNHPIKIIVPFTPGSGSDSSARFFGERLGKELGQSTIVENHPGASGIITAQLVKNQPADGYTVMLASNSLMAVNPFVLKNVPYDPVKDFKPVLGLSRGMNVVIVSNQSPFKNLGDLLAAARQKPLTMGTYSAGYELVGRWLADLTGSQFTNVAYKGGAQIMTDVIGHQLDFALVDLGGAFEMIRSGKLRALAVSGENRNPSLPGTPTVRELGYQDFVQYSWVSFYVRAQTPDDIVGQLAAALQKIAASDAALQHVKLTSAELMPYPPEKMAPFQRAEIERFRKMAELTGYKPK